MRPDGSQDQAIPFIPGNHAAPTLSPDGTRMAVVNLLPDRIEIYDLATHTFNEIAAAAHSPSWSPDGARIAFVNSTTHRIEVIHPDGTGRRIVSPAGHQYGLGLDWTQDGLFILAFDSEAQIIVALDPESGATLEYQLEGIGAPAARPR
jgi:Tol biopolymer transport system component